MKGSELRSMTREELLSLLEELRDEEFKLRIRRSTEELPNPLRLRMIRKDIARIMTILKEDELGVIKLPKKAVKKKKKKEEKKVKKVEEKKKVTAKKKSKKKSPPKKKTPRKSKERK